MIELARSDWTARAAEHAERVDRWIRPHLERRRRGEPHPVHDFLFDYYSQSPAKLRQWHPGYGVRLLDAPEYASVTGYVDGAVTDAQLARQQRLVRQIGLLLRATEGRTASYGCFGLHEWAMVYRADQTRHPVSLRLGTEGTDAVVEGHRITCSHFDAYRFFTPAALPLNTLRPGRDDRSSYEQPGCLHAGMDLYKHSFRLSPLVPSELVADCFELAWDIRVLDMRASPYDLTGLVLEPTGEPWTPVRIETPQGKQEYVESQRAHAERGQVLRRRLIAACDRLRTPSASLPARAGHQQAG